MSKEMVRKVVSFALVGGIVFLLVQGLWFCLVWGAHWNAVLADFLVLSGSIWVNYRLNRRYTWKGGTGSLQAQRFILSRVATMVLSILLLKLFITDGIHYQLANVIAVVAGMAVNFVLCDRWVFDVPGRHRAHPTSEDLSLGWRTTATFAVLIATVLLGLRLGMAQAFLPVVLVLLSLFAAIVAALYLVSLLYAHRHQASYASLRLREPDRVIREKIAVLMPARHETNVLGETLINAYVSQQRHADHRFFPILCDDDPDTIRVALAAASVVNFWGMRRKRPMPIKRPDALARFHESLGRLTLDGSPLTATELRRIAQWRGENALMQLIIFPVSDGKSSKPRQMNYARQRLRDEGFTVFTILDAESRAQKDLFVYVDQAFQDHPEITVIQGAVQLMDPVYRGTRWHKLKECTLRWYAWHNLLEYHRWFSGQMSFQADNDFVPLGGNTVFIRSELLEKTGGWPETLTEDCALGVLLSARYGAKVLTFYEPKLATREETPPRGWELVKQRTRWTQGFLQSLLAGEWRAMPTRRQRLLALWVLSSPLFQALAAPLLPLALAAMVFGLFQSPPVLVLIMFVPLLAMVVVTALQLKQLHEYGKHYGRRVAWYVYVQVIVTQMPYQWLLSFAAFRAVVRHITGKVDWQSPARTGDLLTTPLAFETTSWTKS